MQQNVLDCRQLVKAIRNVIRNEASKLGLSVHPGYIKISLVPYTEEADMAVGGYSDILDSTTDDFASYEYTYAFKPEVGFGANEASSYASISIKKKKLITRNGNEAVSDRVYAWDDFLEIMVRVSGTDDRNKVLACVAYDTITAFFAGQPEFSVSLIK